MCFWAGVIKVFCRGPDGKYFGFCSHDVPDQLLSLPSGCNMSVDWLALTTLCPRAMTCCLYFRVQFSSVTQSSPTLCNPMDCSMPGLPVHRQFLEFTQTHVHWVSDAIQQSHPLSPLLLLPSIPPSIRVFSNESALHIRWPKYWSFSFNISPSNEYSWFISFRMDWLDLLAVQGTLKSLLQHHSFTNINSSALSSLYGLSHIHPWPPGKP